jgi:hypothetical protein
MLSLSPTSLLILGCDVISIGSLTSPSIQPDYFGQYLALGIRPGGLIQCSLLSLLRGLSPGTNYTDRATTACQRS